MKYLIFSLMLSMTTLVHAETTSLSSWDNLVFELRRIKSIPEGHAYLKKQTLSCSSQSALQRLLVAFNANNMTEAKAIKECRAFPEPVSIKILDIYNPLNAKVHLNISGEEKDLDQYAMIANIEQRD